MATYTANEVKLMAVERASLNDDTLIPDTQTWQWMSNFERRAYIKAARHNPDFYGASSTVSRASDTDSWDLSTVDLLSIKRIEVSSITGSVSGVSVGDEVNIVDLEQPGVALAPRVILRGLTVEEYESDLSVDGSNYVDGLKVYYSEKPAEITSSSQNPEIQDEWVQLLVLPLARLFAVRDQRLDEAQVIQEEYVELINDFIDHVQVFDHGANKSLEGLQPVTTRELRGGGN